MPAEHPIDLSEVELLLVEDNDDDAFLFQKKIEQGLEYAFVDDIELTRVDTLNAAMDACEGHSFDVVFLDLGLPDSNGTETIQRFAACEFTIPTIVLTGLRDRETSLTTIRHGAQDYLVKGDSNPETIVRAMRHAIERQANERTVRRQRDQMEFFNSILRHDLLNGLQIIQLRARSLSDRLDGQEQSEIDDIVSWSENIVELTEKTRDIMDTLTSGDQAELTAIDVSAVLNGMVGDVEQMRNGVSVETDCPDTLRVEANDLFEDVLRNLLTNAVVHTKPESVTIQVSGEKQNDMVRLVVEDNGPGIPESQQETLFERGAQGQESTGSGFGLYFVQSMVDTYNGTITVESADSGARFVMELPVP